MRLLARSQTRTDRYAAKAESMTSRSIDAIWQAATRFESGRM